MERNGEKGELSKIRVFLCGAHSTGKTTLLNDVVKCVNISGVPEVARQLIKDLDVHDYIDWKNKPDKFEQLQGMILEKQCEVEEEYRNTDYIADRGIDPLVYARTYLGEAAYQRLVRKQPAQQSIDRYKNNNSLIFVIEPQAACIRDDGFRLKPVWEELQTFHEVMIGVLNELDIPYEVIGFLDRENRVKFVTEKIRVKKAKNLR